MKNSFHWFTYFWFNIWKTLKQRNTFQLAFFRKWTIPVLKQTLVSLKTGTWFMGMDVLMRVWLFPIFLCYCTWRSLRSQRCEPIGRSEVMWSLAANWSAAVCPTEETVNHNIYNHLKGYALCAPHTVYGITGGLLQIVPPRSFRPIFSDLTSASAVCRLVYTSTDTPSVVQKRKPRCKFGQESLVSL